MQPILRICIAALLVLAPATPKINACPYCDSEQPTIAEEMDSADAAVIAKLLVPAPPFDYSPDEFGEVGNVDPDAGKAKLAVEHVLRGDDIIVGIDEFHAIYFGEAKKGEQFFVTAIDDPLDWAIPQPISATAADYIRKLDTVPAGGSARLEFFLRYLQHEDPLLGLDAYEEFARAPYSDVLALKEHLDREQIREWIEDHTVSPSRRSLYFVLLGVCGTEDDIPWLERMMLADRRLLVGGTEVGAIVSMGLGGPPGLITAAEAVAMEENRKKLGFNALVGCYIKLHGIDGLDVIDEHFLSDTTADYSQVYASMLAIRFAGEETDEIPLDRLKLSMRKVLINREFADKAILDLARWQDWDILPRLVEMFREEDQVSWIRESIVAYLDEAAKIEGSVGEEAKVALAEFEQSHAETVKDARMLASYGYLGKARKMDDDGKTVPPNAVRPDSADDAEDPASPESGIDESDPSNSGSSRVATSEEGSDGEQSAETEPEADIVAEAGNNTSEVDDQSDESAPAPKVVSKTQPARPAPPSAAALVGIPLLGGAVLMMLFYVILRGGV